MERLRPLLALTLVPGASWVPLALAVIPWVLSFSNITSLALSARWRVSLWRQLLAMLRSRPCSFRIRNLVRPPYERNPSSVGVAYVGRA